MEATAGWNTHAWLSRRLAITLVVLFSLLRLAHVHLLWADEDYHLAAAIQILHAKIPYRDFWYDKPPLSALYYLLIGGSAGWPLRIFDAVYVIAACWLVYRLARALWTETEGRVAAVLLAFFTTFYLPSAVIPFAADAVMLVPHVAAVYCAFVRKPIWAGALCGVAFLANTKASFVLATCIAWLLPETLLLLAGFVAALCAGFFPLWIAGAWPGYIEQVWRWGLRYAAGSPVAHPVTNGILRTSNWLGFHAAIAISAPIAFFHISKGERWKLGVWLVLSFVAVALGGRFAPHYFLQLLPPLVIAASRGMVIGFRARPRLAGALLVITLLVPLVRFGPRYAVLAAAVMRGVPPNWIDVSMDLDSQDVASFVNARKQGGDTLFVWGYRPDIYVYTRLASDSLFWDSQPITGVAADRHLSATTAIYGGPAKANRMQLTRSRPTWIVDGLGLLNPKLRPAGYEELHGWLGNYELVGTTKLSLIYRRRSMLP